MAAGRKASALRRGLVVAAAAIGLLPAAVRAQWTTPTPEELALTSIAEVPGAAAVILYRSEDTSDFDCSTTVYLRIKVLNESGKEYANVELPFEGAYGYEGIAGRTIHPDGTVIPFTGKPFEKLVAKEHDHTYKVKILTLPQVEVGSILEYRYKRVSPLAYAPDWFIQAELFTRKAHFSWQSSDEDVAWTPLLPPDAKVSTDGRLVRLDVQNIAPQPKDAMMPPLGSVSYRVLFYFTHFKTADQFWRTAGAAWAKASDSFIGPGKGVRAAETGLTAAGDTDEQKLRKIYADIMAMENSDFDRRLTARESEAKSFKAAVSTDDILVRRRGSGNQLTALFVAMARAAGLKAYLMAVSDRSERLFLPAYLSFSQIGDYIAIVNMGGVDTYFDPGQRYEPFARLAWFHCLAGGLRETDSGTQILGTPAGPYKENHVKRTANLTLDERGNASGTVTLTYTGDPARQWRQAALLGDATSIKADLRTELEGLMPAGMEIAVIAVGDLTSYDAPLAVSFAVHGAIGSSTGKRLLVPANLFQASARPRFPSEKRDISVDLRYGSSVQDAVRYTVPPALTIESSPEPGSYALEGKASFSTLSEKRGTAITLYRNVNLARVFFSTAEYPELRGFYNKLEARDQETVVLTRVAAKADAGTD